MTNRELITTDISSVLNETNEMLSGVDWNMSTYPLYNYIMSTTFLKMAGLQEQKMKCICWELASNDFDYRYERFIEKGWILGTCADLNRKEQVYEDLCKQITNINSTFKGLPKDVKEKLVSKSVTTVTLFYQQSHLEKIAQSEFNYYYEVFSFVKKCHIIENLKYLLSRRNIDCKYINNTIIREDSLTKMYGIMIKRRNELAHNLTIYKKANTFSDLLQSNCKYDNFFIYFTLLIIIDNIFSELLNIYTSLQKDLL